MITFETSSPNHFPVFLKNLAITITLVAAVCVLILLTKHNKNIGSYWFVWVVIIAQVIVQEADTKRLLQIAFDTQKQVIIFTYSNAVSKQATIELPFRDAIIKNRVYKAKKRTDRSMLYFMKGRKAIFEITPAKDQFSESAISEIYATALKLLIVTDS